ncbi:hypothetical protein AALP_AA6G336900 [Arabis alpina]|uniref:Nucleoplasmin-like domain-containing protein n=1 Tax=Arabis alpina TaxID=50452 RepID=A0A087GTE4_ARAAL|nr:hypothetical protein AALP_AA6G336900 [Arabis alpina]
MEFWEAKVKAGKPLVVRPEEDSLIHISQASLNFKRNKGESGLLYVTVDGKKLVIGTLSQPNFPQVSFDLVFEKEFELSHTLEKGSVQFVGYRSPNIDEEEGDYYYGSESEEEDVLVAASNVFKAESKPPTELKPESDDEEDSDGEDESDEEEEDGSDSEKGIEVDSEEEDVTEVVHTAAASNVVKAKSKPAQVKHESDDEEEGSDSEKGMEVEDVPEVAPTAAALNVVKAEAKRPTKVKPESDDEEEPESDDEEDSDGEYESDEEEETSNKKRAYESASETPVSNKKAKPGFFNVLKKALLFLA